MLEKWHQSERLKDRLNRLNLIFFNGGSVAWKVHGTGRDADSVDGPAKSKHIKAARTITMAEECHRGGTAIGG